MPNNSTIINYRNMTNVYLLWGTLLCTPLIYSVAAYALQYTTPYMDEKSVTWLKWSIIISVMITILAILFKYTFRQEMLAWIFLGVIGLVGFSLFLVYGWNVWFYSFMAGQFLLLLIMGPYLHFD